MTASRYDHGVHPVGIIGVGAAAPRFRLAATDVGDAWSRRGGRGHVGICGADEDTLTLAAEAALRALRAAGVAPDELDGLWWGTSRPPFAEGPSHAVLAGALGCSTHASGALHGGSTHAGIEALLGAADAIGAGHARVTLVVASDAVVPGLGTGFEARSGAGAAALVLAGSGGTATLGPRVTRSRPLLDRYRGDAEQRTRDLYDARLARDEIFGPLVTDVVEQLATLEVRSWSLPDPDSRLAAAVTRGLDDAVVVSKSAYDALGDTGAAAALLGGIGALDAEGQLAFVGYGGGRATGVVVTVDAPVPGALVVADAYAAGAPISYASALRARGELVPTGETIPMGVPPQSALFARGADEMLGLLGARCVECGTVNTPPSIHPHCIACGSAKFETVSLVRHGVVHTFVVNHTMPAPFEAPLPIAVIDLDDGARIMLQVVGDGTDLAIGGEVELVLRRYAYERGVPVYGYKARQVEKP